MPSRVACTGVQINELQSRNQSEKRKSVWFTRKYSRKMIEAAVSGNKWMKVCLTGRI